MKMQVNGIPSIWGNILGKAVDSYGDYKVATAQRKAIEAQTAAINAQNQASIFAKMNIPQNGAFGIPTEYLLIGGGLLLILLIGGKK